MTFISDYYSPAAIVFSIVGLSMAPLLPVFFKQYCRGLQFLQMAYLFGLSMGSAFAVNLTTAMVAFDKNILTFCTTGDFVCSNGFALSFGVILTGVLLLAFVFVAFRKCCGKAVEYQAVFSTLKGFIKWIYLPLAFISIGEVISLASSPIDLTTFLPPAIVLGVLAVFPIFQLIAYKVIQKEETNIWVKWLQFFGYIRLGVTAALVACDIYYANDIYLHLVQISLIIYPILHIWKADFKYPVGERIVYFLGEAIFLTLFYVFKYGTSYITQYDLDFFGLGAILLIDLVLYFVRTIRLVCYGGNQGVSVNKPVNPEGVALEQTSSKIQVTPQEPNPKQSSPKQSNSKGVTKVAKYEVDSSVDSIKTSSNFIEAIGKKSTVVPKKKK